MAIKTTMNPDAKTLRARHKKRVDKIRDNNRAFAKVAIMLDRWVQKNFRSEGGNVGGWTPFKYGGRMTVKDKSTGKSEGRYINTTAKLLQDTGRLRASFLPFHKPWNAGIGSDLDYSKTHEDGIGVPERRMLPERKEVIKDARKILQNHFNRSIK